MKKLIPVALLLAGCSSSPVIDLKVSEDPKNITLNEMECHYLADKAHTFSWRKPESWERCMTGRGYTIINRSY